MSSEREQGVGKRGGPMDLAGYAGAKGEFEGGRDSGWYHVKTSLNHPVDAADYKV